MVNERIAIVGLPGSGKSTLAREIGQKLNREVIHVDKHFWTHDWKERFSKEDFRKWLTEMADQDNWIIDGNHRATIDHRFERATTIIYLDFPKWRSLIRVFKRLFNRGQPFDKTEGAKEKIDFYLLRYIIKYPKKILKEKIEKFKGKKKIYIARNNREIAEILKDY